MIVVSDTSVITSLIQIGKAELLQKLYQDVVIPPSVEQELLRTHSGIPLFLQVQMVNDIGLVKRLEAEAIALAKQNHADLLLIDEKLGRKAALREGLRITGLIGLIVESKRLGLITSVRKIVEQLELEAGFRISNMVKIEAFQRAGE